MHVGIQLPEKGHFESIYIVTMSLSINQFERKENLERNAALAGLLKTNDGFLLGGTSTSWEVLPQVSIARFSQQQMSLLTV